MKDRAWHADRIHCHFADVYAQGRVLMRAPVDTIASSAVVNFNKTVGDRFRMAAILGVSANGWDSLSVPRNPVWCRLLMSLRQRPGTLDGACLFIGSPVLS